MKIFKAAALSIICVFILMGTVHAEGNALKSIKLGFGFDRDFGITGTMSNFNGFLGNDGIAVDYIFMK